MFTLTSDLICREGKKTPIISPINDILGWNVGFDICISTLFVINIKCGWLKLIGQAQFSHVKEEMLTG